MLDEESKVANAQDYDAWGYLLENRSDNPENSKYKFTGKERDKDVENNYDYGACPALACPTAGGLRERKVL